MADLDSLRNEAETAIAGATGSSYTLAASDVGHRVRVAVTASNST